MERNWNMELFIQKKSVELTFCRYKGVCLFICLLGTFPVLLVPLGGRTF